MEITYFVSGSHPYEEAIYFGVGPSFGAAFGWRVEPVERLTACACDIGVLDNRLEPEDVNIIEAFLARPAERRIPIFFRISDPDMVLSANPCVKYIFSCADRPGVHFATTYDPEGPFRDFVQKLAISRVVHLPYPYERRREVDCGLEARRRRIFLAGANDPKLYPLRQKLRRQRGRNPLLRAIITDLPHPGYPDKGAALKHAIVRERFVDYAARFTHFFLCPTVYESELAKYAECAYAGSVPVGLPPKSLKPHLGDCFLLWRGGAIELARVLLSNLDEMRARAATYRAIMRRLRDPAVLSQNFIEQVASFV